MGGTEVTISALAAIVFVGAIWLSFRKPRSAKGDAAVRRRANMAAGLGLAFAVAVAMTGYAGSGWDTSSTAFQSALVVASIGFIPGTYFIWRYDWAGSRDGSTDRTTER